MSDHSVPTLDLLDQIPDPETIRAWLSHSIQRTDLLRSLLRLAKRKAAYRNSAALAEREGEPCIS
jgi:hypothetical protein